MFETGSHSGDHVHRWLCGLFVVQEHWADAMHISWEARLSEIDARVNFIAKLHVTAVANEQRKLRRDISIACPSTTP